MSFLSEGPIREDGAFKILQKSVAFNTISLEVTSPWLL